MSEPSDYEDGAFYWVRQVDEWTVAKRLKDEWLQLADDFLRADGDFDEIGPCIGKEPPKRRAPRKVKAGAATSAELDNALRILLVR